MAYESRVRAIVHGMLEEHGLDPWLLDRDRRLFGRLALDDERGRQTMQPGRPGTSGFQVTLDVERDARRFWSFEVASALRRRLFGRIPPDGTALVPALPLAVARTLGFSTSDITTCRDCMRDGRQLSRRQRQGVPDWVVDLAVIDRDGTVLSQDGQIRVGALPDTVATAVVGRRLHEIVELPGCGAGTQAGDLEIRAVFRHTLRTSGAWTTAEPLPEEADRRWIDIALQSDAMF